MHLQWLTLTNSHKKQMHFWMQIDYLLFCSLNVQNWERTVETDGIFTSGARIPERETPSLWLYIYVFTYSSLKVREECVCGKDWSGFSQEQEGCMCQNWGSVTSSQTGLKRGVSSPQHRVPHIQVTSSPLPNWHRHTYTPFFSCSPSLSLLLFLSHYGKVFPL